MKRTREHQTANDRLKRAYCRRLAIGMIMAVGAHSVLFAAFPDMTVADLSVSGGQLEAVALTPEPPKVEIPRSPEPITRPATPKVALNRH